MLAFLDGTIEYAGEGTIALSVGGVGYELLVSNSTLASLAGRKDVVRLYTYLQVKDDGVCLFGFCNTDEKAMFLKLLSVGGVGAKTALSVLSGLRLQQLALAIVTGDAAALSKVKGIGKKTAERIVLELREKVASAGNTDALGALPDFNPSGGAEQDAVLALMALGLQRGESARAVGRALAAGKCTTEDLIAEALRSLDR